MIVLAIASAVVLFALVAHSARSLPGRRAAAFWIAVVAYGLVRGIGVRLVTERGLGASFPYAFHERRLELAGVGVQELAGWALIVYLAWWVGSRLSPARLFPQVVGACAFLAAASWAVETGAASAGWWFWNLPAGSALLGPVPPIALVDWAFVGIDFLLPFVALTTESLRGRPWRFATLLVFPLHFLSHLHPSLHAPAHGGLTLLLIALALFSRAEDDAFGDEPGSVAWVPSASIGAIAAVAAWAVLSGGGGSRGLVAPAVLAAIALAVRRRRRPYLDLRPRRAWAVLAAVAIVLAAIDVASAQNDARLKRGLDRAIAARDRGDLATAIRVLTDLESTGSHVPHAMLGEIHYRTGGLDDARAEFERAVAIQPSFVRGHRYLAVVALRRGNPARAAEGARRGLEVRPDDLELGYLERRAGGIDDHGFVDRVLAAGPQGASTIASLAFEVGDRGTARSVVEGALARWPDDPRLNRIIRAVGL